MNHTQVLSKLFLSFLLLFIFTACNEATIEEAIDSKNHVAQTFESTEGTDDDSEPEVEKKFVLGLEECQMDHPLYQFSDRFSKVELKTLGENLLHIELQNPALDQNLEMVIRYEDEQIRAISLQEQLEDVSEEYFKAALYLQSAEEIVIEPERVLIITNNFDRCELVFELQEEIEIDEEDDEEVLDFDGDGVLDDEDCDPRNPRGWRYNRFFRDLDFDGFGDDQYMRELCLEQEWIPRGYAVIGGDCDDTDPEISPIADEIPFDFKDNDCDGRIF